jgi:MYXO-CTERM domain-containing protein
MAPLPVSHRLFFAATVAALLAGACQAEPRPFHYQASVTDAGLVRGPYLQMGTPTSAVVRWRTVHASDSRVSLGATPTTLDTVVDFPASTTEHQVTVGGLQPATRYYYAIGSSLSEVAGPSSDQFFITPPLPGTARPVRVWAIGDSGTGDALAARVRDAYRAFTGGMSAYTDVFLMLGDNAYPQGEDDAHQRAIFEMYPMFLRQSFLWPTIGNHDVYEDPNRPAEQIPYLNVFTLPAHGEAGGLPSGTSRYYAFDFAEVHFICLDSMTSDRHPGSAMLTWLEADLAATTRRWIIAFWHHPPYSKGNHDSDYQTEMIEMRQWVLPILDRHGVDLVLSGHSHTYERSYLLDGHYGLSTTFDPSMKKDPGGGRAAEGAAYRKSTDGKAGHEGAVYVVAGNAGHINAVGPHPAMFLSLSQLGSLVVDVDGGRLEARALRDNGFIDDTFTILKGPQSNQLPQVRVVSPAKDSTITSAQVTVTATASDADGKIARVEFFADTLFPIGSDDREPFEAIWSAVDGVHQLSAVAVDDRGARVTSLPIQVNVPPGVGTSMPSDAGSFDARLEDAEPDAGEGAPDGESDGPPADVPTPEATDAGAPSTDAAQDAAVRSEAGTPDAVSAGARWRGKWGTSAPGCQVGAGEPSSLALFLALVVAGRFRRRRSTPPR